MNILFFAEQSPYLRNRVGGAENSMRLIAEGLAARGHAVVFASLRPDALPFSRSFRANGVRVLICANPRKTLAHRVLRWLARARGARPPAAAGWPRLGAAVFGKPGPASGPAARYDLVYAFYEMEFLRQALAAREASGMAIVMRMAGLNWYDTIRRDPAPRTVAGFATVFNAVDALNYLSERSQALVEARAAEVGLPLAPRASFVADIGVNLARAPALWQGPGAGRGLRIVVATRFSPEQKRQDLIVEAVALLRDRLPVAVTMIGTGASRARIAARRDALGLKQAIEIVPFMEQDQLWRTLCAADLLAHPCDHEGVSKIILEAMMLGLPVLASDVAPLPDYVIEGETGYRVANTPEAWAEKLVEIAENKHRLPALSARARGFVAAHYDMARNIGLYETAFRRLAARPGETGTPETGTGTETGTETGPG